MTAPRDLAKSTETGVSVEPPDGKVTGKGGTKIPTPPPPTQQNSLGPPPPPEAGALEMRDLALPVTATSQMAQLLNRTIKTART